MAKLHDLEELLLEVKNRELIPILREAVSCYNISSFRACIMLSFNALVDDLLIKLKHIKEVNEEGKKIYNHINSLIESQTSFETPLIEQLVKSKIFTELDGELYKTFQKFRHKSAHPSGYAPSAECARFIYTEIINTFLSKETLLSSDRIDNLISDIGEKYFFPTTNNAERSEVAKEEISNILPDAYPQMINKIYHQATKSNEDNSNNYSNFLCALFALDKNHLNTLITKIVIQKNISKSEHSYLFTTLISSNPKAFDHINQTMAKKLIINLKKRIELAPKNIGNNLLSNPYYSYLQVSNKCSGFLKEAVINSLSIFIENPMRLCYFLYHLDKKEGLLGRGSYLEIHKLIVKALNNKNKDLVDEILSTFIEDESQCLKGFNDAKLFEISCAIVINNSNSMVSKKITDDKFEQLKYIIEKTHDLYKKGDFDKLSLVHKMTKDQQETLDSIYI